MVEVNLSRHIIVGVDMFPILEVNMSPCYTSRGLVTSLIYIFMLCFRVEMAATCCGFTNIEPALA